MCLSDDQLDSEKLDQHIYGDEEDEDMEQEEEEEEEEESEEEESEEEEEEEEEESGQEMEIEMDMEKEVKVVDEEEESEEEESEEEESEEEDKDSSDESKVSEEVGGSDVQRSNVASSDDSDEDIYALETPAATAQVNQQFQRSSGEVLTISASRIMRMKDVCYAVIFIDSLAPCWYYMCDQFRVSTIALLQSLKRNVPYFLQNLKDHKLRVKQSPTNEMVFRKNARYPEVRWATVVPLNAVNPKQDLDNQLKKFSNMFKRALVPTEHMTPGRRFMTYCENSGKDNVVGGCGYMGDLPAVEKQTNEELIKLGKKDHLYVKGAHLDDFWGDYSIKEFLENYLGCSSWDDVPEHVKKICYKHYPDRRPGLPDWDNIFT